MFDNVIVFNSYVFNSYVLNWLYIACLESPRWEINMCILFHYSECWHRQAKHNKNKSVSNRLFSLPESISKVPQLKKWFVDYNNDFKHIDLGWYPSHENNSLRFGIMFKQQCFKFKAHKRKSPAHLGHAFCIFLSHNDLCTLLHIARFESPRREINKCI